MFWRLDSAFPESYYYFVSFPKEDQHTLLKTPCAAPWAAISINVDSSITVCSASSFSFRPDGPILLSDAVNHPEFVAYRLKHFTEWPPATCRVCMDREKLGIPSLRRSWDHHKRILDAEKMPDAVVSLESIAHLDINFSNVCNLKCRMCRHERSSNWKNDQQILSDTFSFVKPPEVIKPFLINVDFEKFKNLNTFVIKGGEPLFDKAALAFLNRLVDSGRAKDSLITFFTNGVFVKKNIELLKKFKMVQLMFSFEGTGELYQYIRGGEHDFGFFNENVMAAAEVPNIAVSFMYTPQAYNVFDICSAAEFVDRASESFLLNKLSARSFNTVFSNILVSPDYLSIQALPPEIRKAAADKIKSSRFYNDQNSFAGITKALENDAFDAEKYKRFLLFTKKLDEIRGESFLEKVPAFKGTQVERDYISTQL